MPPAAALTFFCDSCGQPLLLEGEASPGLRVACPSCQATVEVPLPAGDEPLELSWFAMVRGSQVGPMAQAPLEQLIRAGEVTGKSFVWCEGMAEWRRAETLPVLAQPLAATRPPRPANTADLSQLFSDLDLTVSRPMDARAVEQMLSGSLKPKAALPEPVTIPARGAATGRTSTVRSATRRRGDDDEDLEASGLARRNPVWKIALVVVLILAVPVGGLYALSSLQVIPLEVPRVDPATGASVKEPVFSAKGVRGLRDLLLGKKAPPALATPREVRAPAPKAAPPQAVAPAPRPELPASPELKKLYGDTRKADVGPSVVPSIARAAASPASGGGPNQQALAKVVSQSGPAFQSCIEQQLRRTPNFRGGKVNLVATVGASGTVKQARLDRREIDISDLGSCLKSRARRLVFPSFEGEDVEVEIPLVLTAAL
ncbi:MAG TPA: AgmX/PglI C-terminal domain-containing protein [Myxococcaceae bacterium]|nr:AgmX/PglI C-terminal domain-containing protein [Myxococcaceae bacterium]